MLNETDGLFGKIAGYSGLIYLAVPLLALLATGFLHWTMQVFLETNLLLRLGKLIVLPFYILAVVAVPPLAVALGTRFVLRRSEEFCGILFLILVVGWGFWYMLPPIIENWEWFMRFVEEFGAV